MRRNINERQKRECAKEEMWMRRRDKKEEEEKERWKEQRRRKQILHWEKEKEMGTGKEEGYE